METVNKEESYNKRLLCTVCFRGNEPNRKFCSYCWGRLVLAVEVSPDEEHTIISMVKVALLKNRLVVWGSFTAILLLAVFWAGFSFWNKDPHLGPASTAISSSSTLNEWSMQGRDIGRTGYYPGQVSLKGELAWQFDTDAPLKTTPAVAHNRAYLATGDGRMVALDASSGNVIWETKLTGPVDSSPAVAGELLFVGLRDSRIIALDTETGQVQWSYDTDNPISASPLVSKGVVYVGSGDRYMYALDAKTGQLRWRYRTMAWQGYSAALGNGIVAFSGADNKTYLTSAHNGARRLVFRVSKETRSGPVIRGNTVLVISPVLIRGGDNGALWAIDLRATQNSQEVWYRQWWTRFWFWGLAPAPPSPEGLIWRTTVQGALFHAPAVTEDTVFLGDHLGWLYAMDLITGEIQWQNNLESQPKSSPVVLGDTIFISTADYKIRALSVENGEEKWSFKANARISAPPAAAQGILYVTSEDGTLYALK
jgi:outer membrane protein assembly factor BamB